MPRPSGVGLSFPCFPPALAKLQAVPHFVLLISQDLPGGMGASTEWRILHIIIIYNGTV